MTHEPRFAGLPFATIQQIDRLADDFEAAWLAGELPEISKYLARFSGASKEAQVVLEAHLREVATELSGVRAFSPSPVPPGAVGSLPLAAPLENLLNPSSPSSDSIVVGEYRLIEQLGSGGMGVVFKAIHSRLGRTVAIKFPRLVATMDRSLIARFMREARLLGRLDHEHIVRALDAGESPYGPFLVTEFISGETVEARVRRAGPLSRENAISLIREAASALAYSHDRGIVHRDIKPSNLLLDENDSLRIVDFGLAKSSFSESKESQALDPTMSHALLGTIAYAAPEQLRSGNTVDHRADVFSLGSVLYFLLTAEAPHSGSLPDRLFAERDSQSVSLRKKDSSVPRDLERIWRRMVALSPNSRFGSMAEVIHELDSASLDQPTLSWNRRAMLGACLAGFAIPFGAFWVVSSNRSLGPIRTEPPEPPPPLALAPYSSDEAKNHQLIWSQYLGRPAKTKNSLGMPFVLVPPNEFEMGTPESRNIKSSSVEGDWRFKDPQLVRQEQAPPHHVVLTKPLYFGATEVTLAQFRQFVEASRFVTDAEKSAGWGKEDRGWLKRAGYSWRNTGQRVSEDDHPVINVSWNDAVAFCLWLNEQDDLGTYRLPTEAEWEAACRAGSNTAYFFGEDVALLGEYAWFRDNSEGRFRPVGQKRPNPFGIYDLYGNRQEWCQDNYAVDFYERAAQIDPVCEKEGAMRTLRGGTHTDPNWFCNSTRRWGQHADDISAAGIRVVCEIEVAINGRTSASAE